ncbi:MAG: hypothetical protein KIPDCIKN_02310 [Haliscomenobacter sp.]|nr:hypothetical protein [Haliscomenobacter sp.]
MQLASVWLKEHFLLRSTVINFGGRYFYQFDEKENKIIISRTKNEKYIPNLFSGTSPNLLLVSAVVGQNGSGKTTIMRIIRKALSRSLGFDGAIEYEDAILIFENKQNEIIIRRDPTATKGYSVFDDEERQHNKEIELFDIKEDKSNLKIETIYFSPFFDFNQISTTFPDIDISINSIIEIDLKNNLGRENESLLHEYRYQNVIRHLSYQSSSIAKELNKVFNVPFYEEVKLSIRSMSIDPKYFHNTPFEFRPIYQKLLDIWRKEIYSTERQITKKTDVVEDRKIFRLWFLFGLINSLFDPLEKSNTYLNEGKVRISDKNLDQLSLEDALIKFLENNYFEKFKNTSLPIDQVKNLLAGMDDIIKNAEKGKIIDTKEIILSFEDAIKILSLHKNFLNGMAAFNENAVGFIDVGPNHFDLSSGEKAYLDLFSRFYFATEEIINKRKNSMTLAGYEGEMPGHFIILLDEGELGFHPLWKKKYVKSISDIIPKFFEQYEGITVQIIFTTHDPLTLSDMPNYNIVLIRKNNQDREIVNNYEMSNIYVKSFGANVTSILADSFFIDDGLVGEFAIDKINKTIEWLLNKKDNENLEFHQKLIQLIDEPLIQKKLSEMFAEKTGKNIVEEKIIEGQIEALQKRLDKIKKIK